MAYTILDNTDDYGNTSDVTGWGDSLTQLNGDVIAAPVGGTFTVLNWVRNFIGFRIFNNQGIGGQTASQIAARQGGIPIQVTLTGGAFNALNEIDITISNYFLSTPADGTIKKDSGRLNNVPVIITRKAIGSPSNTEAGNYTISPVFTSTTKVPNNSVYIPDAASNAKDNINIIWIGRNDVPNLSSIPDLIDACISSLPRPRRVLVIGVLKGRSDVVGTSNYNAIEACNKILKDRYPDNYIDSVPPTIAEMNEIGYVVSGSDTSDIANGVFPNGMRLVGDEIHLNNWGNKHYGWKIAKFFINKNW